MKRSVSTTCRHCLLLLTTPGTRLASLSASALVAFRAEEEEDEEASIAGIGLGNSLTGVTVGIVGRVDVGTVVGKVGKVGRGVV